MGIPSRGQSMVKESPIALRCLIKLLIAVTSHSGISFNIAGINNYSE